MSAGAPPNVESLRKRLDNYAQRSQVSFAQLQRLIANVVIGQVLPGGVIRGGAALKIRLGHAGVRFTRDLDVARPATASLEEYIDALHENLRRGWSGFTGALESVTSPHPGDIPAEYLIHRFRIRLDYESGQWLSVPFEVGGDDVAASRESENVLAPSIGELFGEIGLERPQPIPLLSMRHQVAQKLHACTDVDDELITNDRAHDLIDLQLLRRVDEFDLAGVRDACRRLFSSRNRQSWPPTVRVLRGWGDLYDHAAAGLNVMPTVESAVEWANDLITEIDQGRT